MSSLQNQPFETAKRIPVHGPLWSRIGWVALSLLLAGFLIATSAQPHLRHRLVPAGVTTFCFAILAWMIRGVTFDGAAAGFLVTSVLFVAGGPAMSGAVLLVFVLTYAATKLGRRRKQVANIAERPAGRDAAQIFANVGCAAIMAALAQLTPWHTPLLAGSVAALAEAACDTVSSETGKALSQTARLITSWQPVPAGTDGAISLAGTVLGTVAAALVGLDAVVTHILSARFAVIAVTAAVLGMFLDSALGATLEQRRWLTNNGVNLLATACAALVAALALHCSGNA